MSNIHDPYEIGLHTCYNDKDNNADVFMHSGILNLILVRRLV